ncbi:MAG: UDP-N-acetylmuramoyl-tripeptide--D-alanyl-D-alanine ligase [Clostridiales bacterium]|nr:UDP-N-acetylmuramoyl-tripeptide--D-alanyl-D-alanine ligase [Clostridiales bacterium]
MTWLWLLVLAAFIIYAAAKSVYNLHMMQLNSYMNRRFRLWAKQNGRRLFPPLEALLPASVLLLFFGMELAAQLTLLGLLLLLRLLYRRPKEKKPLALTKRAKRLYILNITLLVLFAALLYLFGCSWPAMAVLAVLTVFAHWPTLLANALLAPLEKGINNRFLREARKIIEGSSALTVIGVTGSYGKTSVKFILGRILNERYNTLVTPDSYNTPMGLTIVIREKLRPVHEMLVAEMGARQKGDIEELCRLACPKAGIITAVGEQHLETFGSLRNIIETKFELMRSLPENGFLVLNMDDENVRDGMNLPHVCRIVGYSLEGRGDYNIGEIRMDSRGSSFVISAPSGESRRFSTVLLGRHNISNIAAATAAACELGVSLAQAAEAVKSLPPVKHRLEVRETAQGVTIIDDAFNSNPRGAQAALEVLASFPGGRKILITPGMVELGERQAELNRQFALQAAEVCDYIILVGPKQTVPLREGLQSAGFDPQRLCLAADLEEAKKQMSEWARPGDAVLFENDLPDTYSEK